MWSTENNDLIETEALIRDAAWMPQPTSLFRSRVLTTAAKEQGKARRLERLQWLSLLTLAASLLWWLPSVSSSSAMISPTTASTAVPDPGATASQHRWKLVDEYEWGLVQAAIAQKSHSAVLIRGLL